MKKCPRCSQLLPHSEFRKNKGASDGLASYCKTCQKQYARQYYKEKRTPTPKYDTGRVRGETHSQCNLCKNMFPNEELVSNGVYCKTCRNIYANRRHIEKHGISYSDYITMLNLQNNLCYICGEKEKHRERLSIDHDHACCPGAHSCGKCIRGLLCTRCNKTLGMVKDDPVLLLRMADYLSSSSISS